MSAAALIFSYILIWWIVLFMVLPLGGRPCPRPQRGHGSSAPEKTYLSAKLWATSLIALVFLWVLRYALAHKWILLDIAP